MRRSQHDQLQVDSTNISTEKISTEACTTTEEIEGGQLLKPLMRSSGSMAEQEQRETRGLDNTPENTPRYIENFNYLKYQILPSLEEESNYTYGLISSASLREHGALSESSVLADPSLATWHSQSEDDAGVNLSANHWRGGISDPEKFSLSAFQGGLNGQSIVTCYTGSVPQERSDDTHVYDFEVDCLSQRPSTPNSKNTVDEPVSVPVAVEEEPGNPPLDTHQESAFTEILEVGLNTLALDETNSGESLASDTGSDSHGELIAERHSPTSWEPLERQHIASMSAFLSNWSTNFTTHTGHEDSGASASGSSGYINHSASTSSASNYSNKQIVDNREKHRSREDDDPLEPPESDIFGSQDPKEPVKLACPFFKYDPARYNPVEHHTCATQAWSSIDRLKQHLRRSHIAQISCETCERNFDTVDALNDHISMSRFCDYREARNLVGMTPAMVEKIYQRWRGASTREKWDRIYGILFPGEKIPSPYFDADQANFILPSRSQYMLSYIEEQSMQKLKYDLRTSLEGSTNHHISHLPNDAKAEILEAFELVLQQNLGVILSNETPRVHPHQEGSRFDNRNLPTSGQITRQPAENWDSSGGESSNQGLGLAGLPSELLSVSPTSRYSNTYPDQASYSHQDECEGPSEASTYFDDQWLDTTD